VRWKPLPTYAAGQGLWLAGVWLLPTGGWAQALWDSASGWLSAAAVFWVLLRHRPAAVLAWSCIGVALFLNGSGSVVEMIAWRGYGVTDNPNAADVFWLSLYPLMVAGLALLLYRRAAVEETGAALLNTILAGLLNLFLGIFAWELVVWGSLSDQRLTEASRLVVTVYPLADVLLIAFLVRLLLGGGFRNPALLLLLVSFVSLLLGDVGWAAFHRSGTEPPQALLHLFHSSSMAARMLVGAAALHPSMRAITPDVDPPPPLGRLGALGLVASVITAPLVIVLQALLDRFYSVISF
jgi:hypothetical protein